MPDPHMHAILLSTMEEYQRLPYEALARLVGRNDVRDVGAYQLEVTVLWDGKAGGPIRVLGSIDDGGLGAFRPLTEDFIRYPDGGLQMPPARPARIVRGAPYFPVPDVSAIGTYYRDVLGFQCEYSAGDPAQFAIYSRDGSAVMFRQAPDPERIRPNEAQGGTWDVFYWVTDVEALYGELMAKGAIVVYAPVVQPYGMKEFAVRDPNGYVLGFGQEWPAASAGPG